MPPTAAIPSGARSSPPAPTPSSSPSVRLPPSAIGSMPTIVESAVIRIGRKRVRPASNAASAMPRPCSRSWFANSTIRIEFFATSPTSITMPIWLKRLSVVPVSQSVASAPVKESATAIRIVSGWTKLSNCAANTRKITATPSR